MFSLSARGPCRVINSSFLPSQGQAWPGVVRKNSTAVDRYTPNEQLVTLVSAIASPGDQRRPSASQHELKRGPGVGPSANLIFAIRRLLAIAYWGHGPPVAVPLDLVVSIIEQWKVDGAM
ncbi:hypothetical protein PM082_015605, partial [Marasmius tenuissimus]